MDRFEIEVRGRLLVASHQLTDPNFDHAVILVIDHQQDEGTFGVVLNRPSDLPISEVLADWTELAGDPAVLFLGGPVRADEALLGLGRPVTPPASPEETVLPGVAVVELGSGPAGVATSEVRVFVGYAGWGPGQLEGEISAGAWYVVDGDADDVFAAEPDLLWLAALRRRGGMFKTVPIDPNLN